ncbi:MAG TPA: glycosyltransferase family 2 protein [Acidimicrobiia bacterium]|jgi:glycosyltransferase involved in cell wall biosynthesis|nr:glycosyltransferase family 2 protein [Acidimicrobiia bacterium]
MTDPAPLPSLSVVIPALNASSVLDACLKAIFAQDYLGNLDVTVAVGPSSDNTKEVLARWAAQENRLQVVDNPTGRTPTALNLAIAASRGDIVARVDAQSVLPAGYLQQAVSTLLRTGAGNVGGIQHPVGDEGTQRIIALAMRSPFGAGPANFRGHGTEGPTDTVYLGTFTRAALDSVGGYDESLIRNQDYELNWRLRQAGYLVWFDPKLKVDYWPRDTLKKLASQYFQYGAWKRRVILQNPRSLRLRQLAAPGLVLGLLGSALALALGNLWGLVLPATYLTTLIMATQSTKTPLNLSNRIAVMKTFASMHLSWGWGFLTRLAK